MSNVTHTNSAEIIIRAATAEDAREIARVAGRDTHELPVGPLLVATVGDRVRAAISLSDGTFVADPFHPTSELVQMLKIRVGAVDSARSGGIARRLRTSRAATALRAA